MPYIGLVMKKTLVRFWTTLFLLSAAVGAAQAMDTATEAYRAMGIKPADVLTGTALNAKVLDGPDKQVICVTSYFTGKKEKRDAVNVRLDVFARRGGQLVSLYTRDFGTENGGNVGDGNLQVLDLDMDGINEIVASYDSFADPLIDQRLAEVIVSERGGFRTAWSGPLEYDATRAARDVPEERRDRFQRELDYANTLRTRGVTLFFRKKVIAIAGERLVEPKIVEETFPLRAANAYP
jgi:hypothetical protein